MRSLSRILALAAVMLAATPAAAVTMEELYEASVEVAGKGAEARTEGFRRALEQVLIRVSGSSAVLSRPDVEALLEAPARYVQQYRYEALDAAAGADGGADAPEGTDGGAAEEPEPTHRLEVSFAGSRVDEALRGLGVVVWGRQRPEVLVWLAVDDGRERFIVAADSTSAPQRALVSQARERGLPLLLPLLDVTDRSRLEFVDISGGFLDAVARASERYRAEVVLVGHLQRGGTTWRASWSLLGVGERRAWSARARALDDAVASGVHGATDRLAAALAGRTGVRTALRLRVQAVDSLDDYARVGSYLDGLARVRSASVSRVAPHEAVFAVEVRGRPEDLERTIALGSTLVAVERPAAAGPGTGGPGSAFPGQDAGAAAGAGDDAATGAAAAGDAGRSRDGAAAGGAARDGAAAAGGTAPVAADPATGARPVELVFRLSG